MAFRHIKQAQIRTLPEVLEAAVNTTLVGSGNLNQSYRELSIPDRQLKLQEYTEKIDVALKTTIDGDTGTVEFWGYPIKGGAAVYLGTFTFTTDEAVDDEGLFYNDAWVEGTAGQISNTIANLSDGRALLTFNTRGLGYIVGLITALTSTATPGRATLEFRPY